ncbi:MAG: BMP family protein [Casimicrobiaceae bacterium]
MAGATIMAVAVMASTTTGVHGQTSTKQFKVALLLPGKINDKGWNAIGHAGLMKIKSELGAEVAYSEDVVPADQEAAFRDYAARGFSLVLAMGGQYTDGAMSIANQFPNVLFGVIGSNRTNGKNMASFNARQEQTFFLGGVAAALASKSKKIGYISGIQVDNVVRGWMGFEQGVKAVEPNATVQAVWTGNFEDVAKAKEAAIALIDRGFDVIQANSNAATFGAMQAAQERKVFGIGAYGDYTFVAPEAVVTNVIPAMDNVILSAGKLAKSGKFEGKFYLYGFDDFDIGNISPINAAIVGKESAQKIKLTVDDYRARILSKKIEIKSP